MLEFDAREHFDYDPETGIIVRKATGKAAVSRDKDGYILVGFMYKKYRAHRVAWAIHHGSWPDGEIDHINGVRDDNRIENLRCVSRHENKKNTAIPSHNTSGVVGVTWHKPSRKWRAYIHVNGRLVSLGYFYDIDKAREARARANKEYGFHPNHGPRELQYERHYAC